MSEFAISDSSDFTLNESQRRIVEADLGLVGTWWRVISAPRSFFVRAGVHAGNYGDELLVASGEAPNAFIFYFVLQVVVVLLKAALSGSLLSGMSMIMQAFFGVLSMVATFYITSGVVHLLSRLARCSGDFMAAQSIVAFTSAPLVFTGLGTVLHGVPAILGMVYAVVLMFLALRHVYRLSMPKAVVLWLLVCGVWIVAGVVASAFSGQ